MTKSETLTEGFGRTDRYYTKLYEAETNFDCTILIDASASMSYGSGKVNKLEYAKFLAASLACVVLKQEIQLVYQCSIRRCVSIYRLVLRWE